MQMNNTLNLDAVMRRVDGAASLIAGEQVIVTIDRASKHQIKKDLLTRVLGDFQDYVVSNNKNPRNTARGTIPTYYVRDTANKRTLAIDVEVIAVQCPHDLEGKVAERLHGEQTPGQVLTDLLLRWIAEFIQPGYESHFIENYDTERGKLETHLSVCASTQTFLDLKARVMLSGERNVPREIVVGPIEISVRLHGYTEEQKVTVEAGLNLDSYNYVKAYVFDERLESAEALFKRKLKEYFFQHVTFQQFTYQIEYPAFKQPLQLSLSQSMKRVGREVSFINFSTNPAGVRAAPPEFVAVNYDHEHSIPGRTQPVEIQNTVQLYCQDSVAFFASRITDLEGWIGETLKVILKRHLIGKSYVDLLLRFEDIESAVKREMSMKVNMIGYRVDHLVSVPNLIEEEAHLTHPFLLEMEDTFETILDKFEVRLKFVLRTYIPKLDSIERYLNPGTDVKEAIKEVVLREARHWLRNMHPERFYLYFHEPNPAVPINAGNDERLPVKELLKTKIQDSLKNEFKARVVDLTLRVGKSDLKERYDKLCFVIRRFTVNIDTPNPQATETISLTGNFELRGVHSDENGWRRFSVLQLDLNGLQHQLETHLRSELKTYYQSAFMYQNATARNKVFSLIKIRAEEYMREEFGLRIHLTNLDRNTTKAEANHRRFLADLEEQKLESWTNQGKQLVEQLEQLRLKRTRELSIFPIDRKALKQIDENIKMVEEELRQISELTLAQSHLAPTFLNEVPDQLPALPDQPQLTENVNTEAGPKVRLIS
jgi:hypothetical protein